MDLKPCPFCGGTKISTHDGSTFRWLSAGCGECGAQAGEVRVQTMGEGNPVMWQQEAITDAFTEWNRRADVPRQPPQRYDVYAEMGNRNDEVPLVESTPSEKGEWVMWDDIASLFNSPRQEGGK